MMICVAVPFGHSAYTWQLKNCSVVLTDAEGVVSPWNGQQYLVQPRSSSTSSPP